MKIIKYKPVGKGSLIATFSLEIPQWFLQIHELTLFEKNGHRWISFPSRQYEKEGQKKYFSYIHLTSEEKKKAFTEKVLQLLDTHKKEMSFNQSNEIPAPTDQDYDKYFFQ